MDVYEVALIVNSTVFTISPYLFSIKANYKRFPPPHVFRMQCTSVSLFLLRETVCSSGCSTTYRLYF